MAELDPREPRISAGRGSLPSRRQRVPRARRLCDRSAGGHGADRPGLPAATTGRGAPKSSRAAGRCASRWPSCCSKSRICCCSTSRPTTWTWKRATGWKSYLDDYPNAFVLVSHDRYFLDVTVDKIVEIWNKRVYFYTGGLLEVRAAEGRAARAARSRVRAISRSGSSSSKRSSTASARRRPRPSRCRAASRNWRRSSASRFRRTRRPSTSGSRSRSRAGASWRSSRTCRRATARSRSSRDAQFHHRARRPRGAGRRQRRGKVDADQDAGGRRAGDVGRVHAGPQRRARLFRAGSVQGARSGTRA